MKIARLADGQMLEFGDDVDDNEMTRRVQKHMGIQVPPTPEEMMHDERKAVDGQRNKLLMTLAQQVGQLGQVIYKLCEDQKATQQVLATLSQTIASAAQQVSDAVMAPAHQEIDRDEDGKIVSTTIRKGGQ